MNDLVLYVKTECPYCQKVLSYLKGVNKEVSVKNISENPDLRDALIAIGGKMQVPCLIINGEAKYESDDIIHWMRKNLN